MIVHSSFVKTNLWLIFLTENVYEGGTEDVVGYVGKLWNPKPFIG